MSNRGLESIGIRKIIPRQIDFTKIVSGSAAGAGSFVAISADGTPVLVSAETYVAVGSGDMTGVNISVGTGLDISQTNTTSGDYSATINLDLTEVIATDGANRILTSDGDGTLTAESTITFDGSTLTVSGDTSLDGAVVINESSADKDFRVESNSDTHAIYLDGGSSEVGIGISNPTAKLHVNGTMTCEGTASFVQGLVMGGTEFRNDNVSNLTIRPAENKDIVFSTADGALAGYESVLRVDSAQYVAVKSLVVTGSGGNHGLKTQATSGDLEIYSKLDEQVDIATGTTLEGNQTVKFSVGTSDTYTYQDLIRQESGDPRFVVFESTTGIFPAQGDIGGIDFKGYNYQLGATTQISKFAEITAQRVSGTSGTAAGSLELKTLPSYNATLKTGVKIHPNGEVIKPNQPAFLVTATATSNLSIGTTKIPFGSAHYDIGSDFNLSQETFTAPVDGKYFFYFNIYFTSIDTAASFYYIDLETTSQNYRLWVLDPNFSSDLSYFSANGHVVVDMDEGDTAHLDFVQSGGSAQTDIVTTGAGSFFGGYLL